MTLPEEIMHKRLEGKTLRELGAEFALSHERIRQILVKTYSTTKVGLSQNEVKTKLHVRKDALTTLRREKLITPRCQGRWILYSLDDMERIGNLLRGRRCPRCGKLKSGKRHFCRRCNRELQLRLR